MHAREMLRKIITDMGQDLEIARNKLENAKDWDTSNVIKGQIFYIKTTMMKLDEELTNGVD